MTSEAERMREMRDQDAARQLETLIGQPAPSPSGCTSCSGGLMWVGSLKRLVTCPMCDGTGQSRAVLTATATARPKEGRTGEAVHVVAVERACANCGKRFRTRVRDRELCSPLCRKALCRIGYANCVICGDLFVARDGRERKTCRQPDCRRKASNAGRRHRDNMRRCAETDITPEWEFALRQRARKCPLCGVKLTDELNLPNSKHLDHILPRNQGGNHVQGNVRIICARCNLRRPKDGSDFTGQLTLWAQGIVPVGRPDRRANTATCRSGLHPWIPANISVGSDGKRHCRLCRQGHELRRKESELKQCKCGAMFAAPGRTFMCPDCVEASARRAAELHATGLTWDEVAAQVGYGTAEGARFAAKRIGYTPAPGLAAAKARAKATPKSQPLCPDCGQPVRGKCEACTTARAWRAVEMRRSGMTLRAIADVLGFSSITTVTNLMKAVVEIESRMGRPVAHSV